MFELMGWQIKKVDGQEPCFADEFGALGVLYDLASAAEDQITVKDKPERVEKVCAIVQQILE